MLPAKFKLEYYAVKAGNHFILYENTSGGLGGAWSTAGLNSGKQSLKNVSHLAFFGSASAVPEPATWAMMIGGFGMVGGSMRSARRKQRAGASYA
jgi:hypothetical protein